MIQVEPLVKLVFSSLPKLKSNDSSLFVVNGGIKDNKSSSLLAYMRNYHLIHIKIMINTNN